MTTPFIPGHSVKGVVFEDGKVWLRQNEFGTWELPGGMIDYGEQPTDTVVRELREELGLEVTIDRLLDASLWYRGYGRFFNEVLIISYLCQIKRRVGEVERIGEGGPAKFQLVDPGQLDTLDMPEAYRRAIHLALEHAKL